MTTIIYLILYGKLLEIQMNNLFSIGNTTNVTNQTQLNILIINKHGWYAILMHYLMDSGVIIILQAIIYIKISPQKAIIRRWLQI